MAARPRHWRVCIPGNVIPPDLEPIAMAYAGHQFGHFVPQLGDGRAILLGESTRPHRSAPRHSIERVGTNSLFARRRRAGGARSGAARISGERGHARPRHSDDAFARGGCHRRAGLSGRGAARCDIDAGRLEPGARRHFRVLRGAQRYRRRPAARRLRDRAPLPAAAKADEHRYLALLARRHPRSRRRSSRDGCTWDSFTA